MSSPRLVIRIELRRGQLDAQEWASARRIVRWRLQDGVDGFLAAAGAAYAAQGDWRRAVYWIAASVLQAAVTA